jgi:hypothetical protein
MKTPSKIIAVAGVLLVLGGCVSVPSGPGVMVLPGTGMSFDRFRLDEAECRQFASSQVGGGTPDSAAAGSVATSAALGTVIGAAAGAMAGGHNSAAGGAAAGLFVGTAMGAAAGGASQYTLQQRYDISYTQCMYAKGHQVPMAGRQVAPRQAASTYYSAPPPPATGAIPPPPPGAPPPPPPDAR